jgi:hypothetical protein
VVSRGGAETQSMNETVTRVVGAAPGKAAARAAAPSTVSELELSVVIPTFDEFPNVAVLIH